MNNALSRLKSISPTHLIVLGLIVITFLFYCQTLRFQFLNFDDNKFITDNEVVNSDQLSFVDCFSYKFKEHDYFPLTFLIFRVLRLAFGFDPVIFHAINLLLHIANVILVFFLLLKIFERLKPDLKKNQLISAVLALMFSIHPIHVESVSWAIDLKDILFSLFYLSGILSYWKWLESRKLRWYYLAFFLALLSILSKSTAITFIAILFWVDLIDQKKFNAEMLISKIPFFLLTLFGGYIFGLFSNPSATLSGLTGSAEVGLIPYFPSSVNSLPIIYQRIVIASFRFVFWVVHSIFPFELNLFYTRKELLDQFALFLPIIPFVVIASFVFTWWVRKKKPLFFYGILFLLITLSPAFAKTDTGISVFVPDRYIYLPIFGLLLAGYGLINTINKKIILAISIMVIVFWSYLTLRYLPKWKNNYSLYDYCLSINPNSPVPRANRALSYLNDGKKEEAFADFDYFIKNIPQEFSESAYLNRGVLFAERGDTTSALVDFETVLSKMPSNFGALLNCGSIYLAQNQLEKARVNFSKAYDVDSANFQLNKKIASLYNKSGSHAVALQFANKCLLTDKEDIDLLQIKGVSLFYLGQFKESIECMTNVIEKEDDLGRIWYFRSMARFYEKDFQGAKQDYLEALKRNSPPEVKFEKALNDSLFVYN